MLKRFFSSSGAASSKQRAKAERPEDWSTVPALQASELVAFGDEVSRLSVEFDIEALIVSHERWLPWLWQACEGQIDEQLRPDVIRDDRSSELGAWLHDAGRKALGHLPTYDMLLVRNRYFHLKAAELITQIEQGDMVMAERTFRQCEHASRQMVLLLKELKRGLVRNPASGTPAVRKPVLPAGA
ncbi:CZB domain-containing protein [Diaphorobacter caeni]|uniref:CZB domain-containing protein n=1 Tax=Diaphorobacter caeni TaxID=2784387 RepID=UPI001890491D|nr:CZB domain-containing protein [Diaphorobacter caeni]MBF5003926.1 CZB domain-containing protein [Diaphorobacter caeni]